MTLPLSSTADFSSIQNAAMKSGGDERNKCYGMRSTTAQLLGYIISVFSAFLYYYFQEVESKYDVNL